MIGRGIWTAVAAVALVGGGIVTSNTQAQEACSNWQVRKIDKAPAWYFASMVESEAFTKARLRDTLIRFEYPLKNGIKLVQYWRDAYIPDWETNTSYIAPGSIYLLGADTVLFDSNICGYSTLSFNRDSTEFVVGKVWNITEDGHSSNVEWYDLKTRQKKVLHSWIDDSGPQFAPDWPLVAYSDKGDLYIFRLIVMSAELVFQRGGSYAEGACARHYISEIRWSPIDDRKLVFKYYDDIQEDAYDFYEVYWSPSDVTVDSTGH